MRDPTRPDGDSSPRSRPCAAARPRRLLRRAATTADETADDTAAASAAATPARVAVSYEGGIVVLDGETLEVVDDLDSEEFTRLNPAGDGRHVMVTVADGFQLLDTGAGTERRRRELTDTVFDAELPGHVVTHAGRTVLYADGTSDTTIFETADLAAAEGEAPATETVPGTEAHHGVSIVLEDGTFLTTVGDEDTRTGAVAQDADGDVVAENDQCPGIHGEGTAADEVVVFGCEDGALLYADGAFQKLDAPDQPTAGWATPTSARPARWSSATTRPTPTPRATCSRRSP